jgi:hypothetical protein
LTLIGKKPRPQNASCAQKISVGTGAKFKVAESQRKKINEKTTIRERQRERERETASSRKSKYMFQEMICCRLQNPN